MNTQITEDYVSFEVAKLLKEKGFDADCRAYYIAYANGTNRFNISAAYPYGYNFNDDEDYQYSAPTLQMAMKWLREVHKKNINIIYDLQNFSKTDGTDGSVEDVEVYEVDIITKNGIFYIGNYNHYESACEAAIKYCLTNLI